ncbi:MAG: asparagine synthetase B, partial [Fuerstiella sp.]|nr:asparagine synthetase B [Fuerstiella sp.]
MCGIAGVIDIRCSAESPSDRAIRMRQRIEHRGPDSEGVFAEGGIALAHTRLSILDLTDNGRQPMTSSDGRYTIVFNGEIYNFQSLRNDLKKRGVR